MNARRWYRSATLWWSSKCWVNRNSRRRYNQIAHSVYRKHPAALKRTPWPRKRRVWSWNRCWYRLSTWLEFDLLSTAHRPRHCASCQASSEQQVPEVGDARRRGGHGESGKSGIRFKSGTFKPRFSFLGLLFPPCLPQRPPASLDPAHLVQKLKNIAFYHANKFERVASVGVVVSDRISRGRRQQAPPQHAGRLIFTIQPGCIFSTDILSLSRRPPVVFTSAVGVQIVEYVGQPTCKKLASTSPVPYIRTSHSSCNVYVPFRRMIAGCGISHRFLKSLLAS